jgi:hypothetical protein
LAARRNRVVGNGCGHADGRAAAMGMSVFFILAGRRARLHDRGPACELRPRPQEGDE